MRLYHTDLIPALPRLQFLGQWRELNSIFKNQNRHILINFVYDYPKEHLWAYSNKVYDEMKNRGYKCNLLGMYLYCFYDMKHDAKIDVPFPDKMTDRYLRQCYYNLQEKYDCGAISEEDWQKIETRYNEIIKEAKK